MKDVFIGRQPIFDRQGKVYAYELLWRDGNSNSANISDGDHATTVVMLNALTEIGLDPLVGQHRAFINLTRNFILGDQPLPAMGDRIVLEILEDIEVDDALLAAIKKLSSQGYTIALDDFLYQPNLQPLVDLADIIKIDLLAQDEATLQEHVQILQRSAVKLLAEKVEDQRQHELCLELGFDYFQGYFFARPNIVQGKKPPSNKMAIIQLLAQLSDPRINSATLENLIMQDVTLSFRVLRYINSARYNLQREIESIQQAVLMLGLDTLRQLVNLLALSRIEDKPKELMMTALIRGRMCEQLAKQLQQDGYAYFTAGLFSILDALMDQPMPTLLEQLPLAKPLKQALLHHSGEMGEVLRCVIAYDRADWQQIQHPQLDANTLRQAYLEAIDWAGEAAAVLC